MAVSSKPVVLARRAFAPFAVLPLALLLKSAPSPVAVLSLPVVLNARASVPFAVLEVPTVCSSGQKNRWQY